MAKLVDCCVCGKSFAITDEAFDLAQEVSLAFVKEKSETKFICKYCKKMIKKEDN